MKNVFNPYEKIVSADALDDLVTGIKSEKKTISFTNGCFDILHLGHITLLLKASAFADILIVGLNNDSSVKRIKGGNRPINNQQARSITLASLQMVDYVTFFDEDTPINLIKKIKPDFLIKGGDWKKNEIVGADFVKSYGGIIKIIPYIKGYSTTHIIKNRNK